MSNEQPSPQVADAELLAYLDGELEEVRARQIEQDAAARQRLALLVRQQRRLAAVLYRADCPDAHTLGEYHLHSLAEADAERVAQHLDICPHCVLELDELRGTLRELAADLELSASERLRLLVARLAPQWPSLGSGPAPMPALAGVRGATNGPLLYEAGDVQVSVEVQDDAAAAGRKSVLGLVTGADAAGWQATLWLESGPVAELVQSVRVDELGNFVFDGLSPGTYALSLRGDAVEVVVQELAVA